MATHRVIGDCPGFCVRGHSDAAGGRAWSSRRTPGSAAGRADPQAAFAKDGLLDELKKALAERALNAEMDHHLDGEAAEGRANSRNGYAQQDGADRHGKLELQSRATGWRPSTRS